MAQSIEEKLLEAIEKDDVKAFNALMENAQCGAYRLGRFPVLSLLYLYKSRKILAAYEKRFLIITVWEELKEPASVASAFSEKAGKCLRLYLNEVVSPLEMLLILDKTKKLKRVYPSTRVSSAIKARLQSVYSVKYSLDIKFEGNEIIIDKRPLSSGEKKKIATICLCSFLAVAVAVAAPVTTVALVPRRAEGEVTKLAHIDFTAKRTYTLKKNIEIPENFSVEKMNCSIIGEGKKLIFGKGASLGELGGKLSGVEIESAGSPLFSTVAVSAEISDVTLNVTADIVARKSTALLAVTNYGTIDGVTVNVSGKLSALGGDSEFVFGGIALNNSYSYTSMSQVIYGAINNCTVNYDNFSLVGEVRANAAFGGIVGVNGGLVLDSKVTGEITADTVDTAGVCAVNNYGLSGVVNEANITQVSSDGGWSPVVSGIVIENAYVVEFSKNIGNLSAKSTAGGIDDAPSVTMAGIAYTNSGNMVCCTNEGTITAEGKGAVCVGGIVALSVTPLSYCLSSGDIFVTAATAYVGGIVGRIEVYYYDYFGFADYCISEAQIGVKADGEKASCVGGIAGFIQEGVYSKDGVVEYFGGGGVRNSLFLGGYKVEGASEKIYYGNIVGVCGADIYEVNSYVYGTTEHKNFEGNYYLQNSAKAFGMTATKDDEFVEVEDKEATPATREEIEKTDAYKKILRELAQ